ncbi:MAG: amidohydrolase family protein [Brevundimonas sp.]|nr:amidohydrolase family protein [Brevundimonas sp.]
MMRSTVAAAALWLALSPGLAMAGPELTVVDAARVFDGERVITDARLILRHGRVEQIGTQSELEAPVSAQRIRLDGRTLIPGLIAAHSHVGMVNGVDAGGHNYTRETVARDLAQFQRFGVVAVNALGMNGDLFHELRAGRDERARGSISPGADLYGAGGGVGAMNGAPPEGMGPPDTLRRAGTPDEARAAVDAMADAGVDVIKVWVDDLNDSVPKMAPEIYAAAIQQAHARGLTAAAHIHDLEDAKGVIRAGVDIIGHGVRDVPVDQEFIDLLKTHDVWYVPTVNINEAEYIYAAHPEWLEDPFFRGALNPALEARFRDEAWREQALGRAAGPRRAVATNIANLRTLHQAGVKIAFGTDSGATPLRVPGFAEHLELGHMVAAGMTPVQALTVATSASAEMMGLEDRGCLRVGCRADFVVLTGDATSDIAASRTIEAVWRDGQPLLAD